MKGTAGNMGLKEMAGEVVNGNFAFLF